MLRVLVLIGAFLFLRSALPQKSRWPSNANTPYRNALDGMLSPNQVSSVLDESMPYESWVASHRADSRQQVRGNDPRGNPQDIPVLASSAGQRQHREMHRC